MALDCQTGSSAFSGTSVLRLSPLDRSAWNEIYLLTEEKDAPVTEEEVYRIFFDHTPDAKIEDFTNIYSQWHGGDFLE